MSRPSQALPRSGAPQAGPPNLSAVEIDDLPTWMRPRRRSIDWGLLFALMLSVLAAWPLMLRSGLPRDTAAELFEYRSQQVARLVRQGIFYTRWLPDSNYGYGSPLFNYLAPLPHYLPGYHQALTDTAPADSVRLFMALAIAAAGVGLYLFARGRWGSAAGVVGALAYVFSGPIALALPYFYGDLGLLMALGLLPWAAWALDRLMQAPTPRTFGIAGIALSLFGLCDARLSFLGGAALLLVVVSGRRGARRYALGAGLVALGLTAFFWLPAWAELDAIRWQPAVNLPYVGPISLAEGVGPMPQFDPQLLNAPAYRGMGPGVPALALLGVVGMLVGAGLRHRVRTFTPPPADSLIFLSFGVILLALAAPPLYSLWPDPSIFQAALPYHALLIATFCLALSAARATIWPEMVSALSGRRSATFLIFLPLLCLIAPLAAHPASQPPLWPTRQVSALPDLRLELQGELAATLRHGVLLPAGTPELPPPPPRLAESLQLERLDRVNRENLRADSQIDVLERGALRWLFVLNLNQRVATRFFVLNYPGWEAAIGGQSIPVQSAPDGFVLLDLPAVNGELTLWFGSTPIRDLADLISLGTLGISLLALRLRWPAPPVELRPTGTQAISLAAAALLCGAWWLLPHWASNPAASQRSARGEVLGAVTPLPRFFQGGVDLLGYTLPETQIAPGSDLSLTLFWQAARPLLENNQSEIWLARLGSAETLLRAAHRHPGSIPTLRWPLGKYVRDAFMLRLPPDFPEGDYLLRVAIGPCPERGLLPCESIQGMDAYNATGQSERSAVVIPQAIRVRRP